MKNRSTRIFGLLCVPVVLVGLWGCGKFSESDAAARVPQDVVFQRDVKPILEIECLQCHNQKDAAQNAGLSLETREQALTTGRSAPVIIPGNADESLLVQVLQFKGDHPMNMPPAPDKIWGERLENIKQWINDGVAWPEEIRLVPPQDWEP